MFSVDGISETSNNILRNKNVIFFFFYELGEINAQRIRGILVFPDSDPLRKLRGCTANVKVHQDSR